MIGEKESSADSASVAKATSAKETASVGERKPSFGEATEGKKELNLKELKKKLEEYQKIKDEYLAGWQKARAELLNYKKEEMERAGDILKYAAESLILKILPILDNFEIAEKNLKDDLKSDEQIKGILQIKSQLQDFLKKQEVEEIKSVRERFDPNFMEVVEEVEAEDKESGTVIEETQKGYKIHGKVLRPAKVRVTK